jgi:uncharacterized membrane protein
MRVWALYLYLAMFIVSQIVLIVMHVWSPLAIILPIVVVIIGFSCRSRMQ